MRQKCAKKRFLTSLGVIPLGAKETSDIARVSLDTYVQDFPYGEMHVCVCVCIRVCACVLFIARTRMCTTYTRTGARVYSARLTRFNLPTVN